MLKHKSILFILIFLCFEKTYLFSQNNHSIILIGDTQRTLWFEFFKEQNEEARQLIFPQIAIEMPSALFILGDLTNWGSSMSEWEYFDKITSPVKLNNIPIYPVMGNHDYWGDNTAALRYMNKRFGVFPENTWYSKTIGSIGFVVLNSILDELNENERAKQKYFLDSALNSLQINSEITHIVCCWHYPIYTNSTVVDDDKETADEFLPILKKFRKVKLIASGHCHSYEHFYIDSINYLVSGGAGGPRQKLLDIGDSRHKDLFSSGSIRDFHYCILEEKNKKIQVRVIHLNEKTKVWEEYDSWDIE